MEFTTKQTGWFSEEVYFDVPDEHIRQKLQEFRRRGYDYDKAKEELDDWLWRNRWDYHSDYGDRDDNTDEEEPCEDYDDGLADAMIGYDELQPTLGEME